MNNMMKHNRHCSNCFLIFFIHLKHMPSFVAMCYSRDWGATCCHNGILPPPGANTTDKLIIILIRNIILNPKWFIIFYYLAAARCDNVGSVVFNFLSFHG